MLSLRKLYNKTDNTNIQLKFNQSNRNKVLLTTSVLKSLSIMILGILINTFVGGSIGLYAILALSGISIVILVIGVTTSKSSELLDIFRAIAVYFVAFIAYGLILIVSVILNLLKIHIAWIALVSFFYSILNFGCYYGALHYIDWQLQILEDETDKF